MKMWINAVETNGYRVLDPNGQTYTYVSTKEPGAKKKAEASAKKIKGSVEEDAVILGRLEQETAQELMDSAGVELEFGSIRIKGGDAKTALEHNPQPKELWAVNLENIELGVDDNGERFSEYDDAVGFELLSKEATKSAKRSSLFG